MIRFSIVTLILTGALLLGGCQSVTTNTNTTTSATAATPASKTETTAAAESAESEVAELPPASFTPETLYALLVAELAGQRDRYDILLSNYLNEAQTTGDAGIAERTTRLASYLKADEAALAAAEIWSKAQPQNLKAKQALGVQLVKAKRYMEALEVMEQVFVAGGETNFEYLAVNSRGLNQSQRNEILERLDALTTAYPADKKLLLAKTILLQTSGRIEEALASAMALKAIQQDNQSVQLVARLQHQLGETEKALKELEDELLREDNKAVRVLYGQILIDQKQLIQAQEQFDLLVKQSPKDGQLRLTLALIAMENNLNQEAQQHLMHLLDNPDVAADANYYLAQLADKADNLETALHHYGQIQRGNKLLPAFSRLGQILLDAEELETLSQSFATARQNNDRSAKSLFLLQGDLLAKNQYIDEALALFGQALEHYPDDASLLYGRAMTYEKINDLEGMERDLRVILSTQPDNAMVLNTLGYTLADRTDRLSEALELITRANELKPNDPAITDSLGWALYRMGNYREAIILLEKALEEYPDHEVAAHLGEALWMNGDRERAYQVWQEAFERQPDSEILKRVFERFEVEFIQ